MDRSQSVLVFFACLLAYNYTTELWISTNHTSSHLISIPSSNSISSLLTSTTVRSGHRQRPIIRHYRHISMPSTTISQKHKSLHPQRVTHLSYAMLCFDSWSREKPPKSPNPNASNERKNKLQMRAIQLIFKCTFVDQSTMINTAHRTPWNASRVNRSRIQKHRFCRIQQGK